MAILALDDGSRAIPMRAEGAQVGPDEIVVISGVVAIFLGAGWSGGVGRRLGHRTRSVSAKPSQQLRGHRQAPPARGAGALVCGGGLGNTYGCSLTERFLRRTQQSRLKNAAVTL